MIEFLLLVVLVLWLVAGILSVALLNSEDGDANNWGGLRKREKILLTIISPILLIINRLTAFKK